MDPYQVLITPETLSLPTPSARDRQRLLSFFDSLSHDPFQRGDYEEYDAVGRSVQIRIIGRYALTFWADHAVRGVKVTRIETAE